MSAVDPHTLSLLRGISLFAGLGDEALSRIAGRVVTRRFSARATVFRRGEPCAGLFLVIRGRVRVYRANAAGKEQVLHEQGPGEALAEVPLFDGGPYPAHARAMEDSELLFLPRDAFRALYRSEHEIADAVIGELGRRLRRAVRLIEKISLREVPARVGLTLLEYAEARARTPTEAFTLPVTQTELAEALATTRESVARALGRLRTEGFIEQEGARVRIVDPEGLEARCYGL